MATILKYNKEGVTKCAGGMFQIIKVGSKFQAIDYLTGFEIGPAEKSKAYADVNIVNECKNAGLPFTRENTYFTN